jgi:hypothetical protein
MEFRNEQASSPRTGLSGSEQSLWNCTRELPPDTLIYRLMLNDSAPGDVVLRFYQQKTF